jgi:hypothetical protein
MTHYNKHRAYYRRRNPDYVQVGAELVCPACQLRFVKRHGCQKFCSTPCRNHASYARRRAVLGKTPNKALRQERAGDEAAFMAGIEAQMAAVRANWTEAERRERIADAERVDSVA